MNKTSIEWVKNPDGTQGYTWNPITGCLNGCEYCYARKLANTRLRERYLANKNLTYDYLAMHHALNRDAIEPFQNPFYPRLWEDRLEPVGLTGGNKRPHSYGYLGGFKDHKPKGIFVCDMSDLFGIGIPEEWTQRVMDTIKKCSGHRFYLLTKQPQNLIKWSPFPDNCWVGVSATDMDMFRQAMKGLIDVQAKVKYISFEPLLQHVFVDPISFKGFYEYANMPNKLIDWVIIGAQTKPYRPPKIEWVREIVEACDKAEIPVFLKDNLWGIFPEDEIIPSWAQMGKGQYRQEMP